MKEMQSRIYSDCLKTAFATLPSEADLLAFEAGIDVKLPSQYRIFLLRHNGGFFEDVIVNFGNGLGDGLAYLSGIGASNSCAELGEDLDVFEDPAILPIGYTHCGTYLLIGIADDTMGKVLIHNDDGFRVIADSFNEFFESLKIEKE